MKTYSLFILVVLLCSSLFLSCEQEEQPTNPQQISIEILEKLEAKGYNVTDKDPLTYKNGYIVEGDIFVAHKDVMDSNSGNFNSSHQKQYSSANIVDLNGKRRRRLKVYVTPDVFDDKTDEAIDLALERYNDEKLTIRFQRVYRTKHADIQIVRMENPLYELFGILGFAGFPDEHGDPFDTVNLNGLLSTALGYSKEAIATVVAHEIGHTIGFRHTDFYDRGISCSSSSNEGIGESGLNYIPGTPFVASLEDASWMLSCLDGGDRPFNEYDVVALNYLY